jgi:transposase
MANKQNRYAPEFRRQMVELARAGRTPAELSREFGPSAWTIALILTRGAELALDAGTLAPAPGGQPGAPAIETLEAAERSHILKALEWHAAGG